MRVGPARTLSHAMIWSLLLDTDEGQWLASTVISETVCWVPQRITRHLKTWEAHRWVETRKIFNQNCRWAIEARLTPQGRVFARVWYEYGDLLVQMDQ